MLDKNTGDTRKELGPILYYSNEEREEYIVTLINDSLPLISMYDLKSNTQHQYPILNIEDEIASFMLKDIFPENHFHNSQVIDNVFETEYSYKIPGNDNWLKTKISIDLLTIESNLTNALNKIENQLDSTYLSLTNTLSLSDKETLIDSQKAWIKFRDSDCVFKSQKNSEGKIGYKMFLDCKIEKTKLRINELREILDNGF